MKNQFLHDQNHSQQQVIYQAIKKQVMSEHKLELVEAVGWQKYWVRWKISMITETRYRGMFFLGAATKLP